MQKEYRKRDKKLCMCLVDLEKAFDRVSRRVMQWTLRKKGLPEILVKAVMSLYEGSKKKIKVVFKLSEKFYVVMVVHQGSVLSHLLFAIVVDVVTENARDGSIKNVLCTDDLVLMSKMMEGLKKRLLKLRSALESKKLKVKFEKIKMMVCGSEGEIIQSRIDPCEIPYISAYKTTLKVKKRLIQPNKLFYTTDIKVFMVYKTDIILYHVLSDGRLIHRNIRYVAKG